MKNLPDYHVDLIIMLAYMFCMITAGVLLKKTLHMWIAGAAIGVLFVVSLGYFNVSPEMGGLLHAAIVIIVGAELFDRIKGRKRDG